MSTAEWDEDGYEPPGFTKPTIDDRWEGEDEEDVKKNLTFTLQENWDDEEPEKEEETAKPVEAPAAPAIQTKKKKSLAQVLAEKEEKKRRELEERRQKEEEAAAAAPKPLSPEEIQAERLRQQKLQEEADLQLAKEAFGVSDTTSQTGIDAMHPTSKEDFEVFRKELVKKLSDLEKSPHYVTFLDDLFRELCLNLDPDDIKKLGSNLNALFNEKVKAQKSTKQKKKKKGASLNVGKTDDYAADYAIEYADEYEDFI